MMRRLFGLTLLALSLMACSLPSKPVSNDTHFDIKRMQAVAKLAQQRLILGLSAFNPPPLALGEKTLQVHTRFAPLKDKAGKTTGIDYNTAFILYDATLQKEEKNIVLPHQAVDRAFFKKDTLFVAGMLARPQQPHYPFIALYTPQLHLKKNIQLPFISPKFTINVFKQTSQGHLLIGGAGVNEQGLSFPWLIAVSTQGHINQILPRKTSFQNREQNDTFNLGLQTIDGALKLPQGYGLFQGHQSLRDKDNFLTIINAKGKKLLHQGANENDTLTYIENAFSLPQGRFGVLASGKTSGSMMSDRLLLLIYNTRGQQLYKIAREKYSGAVYFTSTTDKAGHIWIIYRLGKFFILEQFTPDGRSLSKSKLPIANAYGSRLSPQGNHLVLTVIDYTSVVGLHRFTLSKQGKILSYHVKKPTRKNLKAPITQKKKS